MNWYKYAQTNPFIPAVLDILNRPVYDATELPGRLGMSGPVPMPEESQQISAAIEQINSSRGISIDQMNTVQLIREFLGQVSESPVDEELDNAQVI